MAKKTAIHIQSVSDHDHGSFEVVKFLPFKVPPKREFHRHDYYEILFFEKGGGEHIIDFKSFPVHDHSAHFVLPGQVHKLERKENSCGYVLLFGEDILIKNQEPGTNILLDLPFYNQNARTDFFIAKGAFTEIGYLLEKVIAEEKGGLPLSEKICGQYIMLILHLLSREGTQNKITKEPAGNIRTAVLVRLKHLLEKNYASQHKPAFYADALNITPGYLNELVHKALGKASSELIQDRLLLESKRLLFYTDLSVNEIAYAVGFEDPAYFSRLFKKILKSTPSEYREAIRKKSR